MQHECLLISFALVHAFNNLVGEIFVHVSHKYLNILIKQLYIYNGFLLVYFTMLF